MSERDWQWPLEDGEILIWQGRPAPRCFTFRNWKLGTAATLLFLGSSFWMMLAYELVMTDGTPWWLILIPAPLVLLSLWFGPVGLLLTRIRWEKEFYALTDFRLLVRNGFFSARINDFVLEDIVDWKQKKYSEQLISVRMQPNNHQPVILHCLEQPQNLLEHLHRIIEKPDTQRDSV